jgi:hypothetical protein
MTMELAVTPERPTLTVSRDQAISALCVKINEGIRFRRIRVWSVGQLDRARELKQAWTLSVTKLLTQFFARETEADEFNRWTGKILPEFASLGQFVERYADEMDQRLKKLVMILKTIEEDPSDAAGQARAKVSDEAEKSVEAASHEALPLPADPITPTLAQTMIEPPESRPRSAAARSGALILLAGDEAVAESIGRFVTMLGYELLPVGVDEVGAKSLIQKLSNQQSLDFAFVLADRLMDNSAPDPVARPSQRWEFELGYCVGRLGAGRVYVLHIGGLGAFYDDHGLLHIPLDPADGWQLHLARQLKRSGIDIDLNRLC